LHHQNDRVLKSAGAFFQLFVFGSVSFSFLAGSGFQISDFCPAFLGLHMGCFGMGFNPRGSQLTDTKQQAL